MFQFTALPMGLSSSPRTSSKSHNPVFATLRWQFGYSCLGCIDDSFYTKDTLHQCQEATLYAVQLFIKLRYVVHPTNLVFQPTQSLEFLAFVLDSILLRVPKTKVKVDNILALCRSFLANRSFTIRHVASLIETLVSTFPGVELGPLHTFGTGQGYSPSGLSRRFCGVPDFILTSDASLRGGMLPRGPFGTYGLWFEAETKYTLTCWNYWQ